MQRFRQPFVGGVPLGAPGVLDKYRLSTTEELERDLARAAPIIAPFESAARSRPGRPTRHRLIRLVEAAEADLSSQRAGGVGRHLVDVVELGHVLDLFDEWKNDPAGAQIVGDLKDPGVYAHDVLVLAAARVLKRSWHNDVELVKRRPSVSADLGIRTSRGRVAIELKAPHELDGNDEERKKSAAQVADAVLRRSSKQRRTAPASLLVVAGYRIPDGPRMSLMQQLVMRLARRPNVAAVVVLGIGNHPAEESAVAAAFLGKKWPRAFTPAQTTAMLALVIAMNVGRNHHYRGAVPIVDLEGPEGLRLPHESVMQHWDGDGRPSVIARGQVVRADGADDD